MTTRHTKLAIRSAALAGALSLALQSNPLNAMDLGLHLGLGKCYGNANIWDTTAQQHWYIPEHKFATDYFCNAGVVAEAAIKLRQPLTENLDLDAKAYHYSHPEGADVHPSRFHDRTSNMNGFSVGVTYWFRNLGR